MKNCPPNKCKRRDNKFGVTWCIKCGALFTKPCGKPFIQSDQLIIKYKQNEEISTNSRRAGC